MAANSATYRRTVTGHDALSKVLNGMATDMRTKVLAAGVAGAIKPINRAAKVFAKRSERTGALRQSITDKVVAYPQTAKAVGLVGPDRNFYRAGKRVAKNQSKRGADRPSKYAHLVEYGHHVVAPKKGTSLRKGTAQFTKKGIKFVPAKPFIRPAVSSTLSEQGNGFFNGIARGIEASRKRLVEANAHIS